MVLVSGEALIDMIPRTASGGTAFVPAPGGSPFNVAVALGRLGISVSFLCRLSNDFFGDWLSRSLVSSQVEISLCPRTEALSTLGFVHFDQDRTNVRYEFYTQGTAGCALQEQDLPLGLNKFSCLHFGSFALAQEPIGSSLETLLTRRVPGQWISVDPNIRPFLVSDRAAYEARLERFLAAADVVKLSLEDLAWLHPGVSAEDCCERYLRQNAKLVIVTRGECGALAASSQGRVEVPMVPVQVVDTVGAGDCFQAAALAWLGENGNWNTQPASLSAEGMKNLLVFASRAAAINCSRAGCNPPWRRELL